MPTYSLSDRFVKDLARLGPQERARFLAAVQAIIDDLRRGQGFRPGLRVKGVKGFPGVYEMTWAPNGRATWEYGSEQRPGEPHVMWRRVGTHEIFQNP